MVSIKYEAGYQAMNYKSFVSCKLHIYFFIFFSVLLFMEALGITRKAAKEGVKFIFEVV